MEDVPEEGSESAPESAGAPRASTIAHKLTRLFEVFRDPDGKAYSPEHVAYWIKSRYPGGEKSISTQYIYMLRNGARTNPTVNHITALAEFFEVPPGFFFDDETSEKVLEQLELLDALRQSDVTAIALRSAEVTPEGRRSVLDLLKQMRPGGRAQGEGFSPPSAEPGPDDPGSG